MSKLIEKPFLCTNEIRFIAQINLVLKIHTIPYKMISLPYVQATLHEMIWKYGLHLQSRTEN